MSSWYWETALSLLGTGVGLYASNRQAHQADRLHDHETVSAHLYR